MLTKILSWISSLSTPHKNIWTLSQWLEHTIQYTMIYVTVHEMLSSLFALPPQKLCKIMSHISCYFDWKIPQLEMPSRKVEVTPWVSFLFQWIWMSDSCKLTLGWFKCLFIVLRTSIDADPYFSPTSIPIILISFCLCACQPCCRQLWPSEKIQGNPDPSSSQPSQLSIGKTSY